MTISADFERGEDALRRGAWQEAFDAYTAVLDVEPEHAGALEGLGTACWWLELGDRIIDARERAFRAYRAAGDNRSAARVAFLVSVDHAVLRGDLAVSSGWLQRSESLLKDIETCPEHVWLRLNQAFCALLIYGDLAGARRYQIAATEVMQELREFDAEMVIVSLDGLILVREGRIAEGMRRIDEAMTAAIAGEMSDLWAIGNTCCALIYACQSVADYDRAAQWCNRTIEFCKRWGLTSIYAECRNHYATILIWLGEWAEAEVQLTTAARDLEAMQPQYAPECIAKLGELRRRQGRFEEAEALFAQAYTDPLSLFGRGAIALTRGDAIGALEQARRFLRRVEGESHADQVFGLGLCLRANLAQGDLTAAETDVVAIEAIVSLAGTRPLRAELEAGRGLIAAAREELTTAQRRFEDAIDLFEACDAAFDAARVRLDLAAVLGRLGRDAAALETAMMAQQTFKRLGAAYDTEQTTRLIERLGGQLGRPPGAALPSGLTPREAEVLWLIAAGKTNQEIAATLVLSVRTVERHISTIYEKLQLHGRAARAAAAAFALKYEAANRGTASP